MEILYSKSQRSTDHMKSASWVASMMKQIASRFETQGEPEFPCVFAQNAYARGNILCLPVPYGDKGYDYSALFEGLKCFLDDATEWDGSVNTARPLLVLFEPVQAVSSRQGFEQTFVDAMQYLIDHDPKPWVENTPTSPDCEFWSMCFYGQQIFVNVSHPQNVQRRSRNLCDCMVLVVNPRERFDVVAGAHRKGFAIREKIRENIDLYDAIPRSPLLGHYQAGELEWPQYMLPDDNESPPMQCPLKFRHANGVGGE